MLARNNSMFQASLCLAALAVAYALHAKHTPFVSPAAQRAARAAAEATAAAAASAGKTPLQLPPPRLVLDQRGALIDFNAMESALLCACVAIILAVRVRRAWRYGCPVCAPRRAPLGLTSLRMRPRRQQGMVFSSAEFEPGSVPYVALTVLTAGIMLVAVGLFLRNLSLEVRRTCRPHGTERAAAAAAAAAARAGAGGGGVPRPAPPRVSHYGHGLAVVRRARRGVPGTAPSKDDPCTEGGVAQANPLLAAPAAARALHSGGAHTPVATATGHAVAPSPPDPSLSALTPARGAAESSGGRGDAAVTVAPAVQAAAAAWDLVTAHFVPLRTPAPPLAPGLPPGWEVRVSRSSGGVYYVHSASGLSSWTVPVADSDAAAAVADSDAAAAVADSETASGADGHAAEHSASAAPAAVEPCGAGRASADGCTLAALPPAGPAPEQLPPGWVACVSRSSGGVYYRHFALGLTSWTMPTASAQGSEGADGGGGGQGAPEPTDAAADAAAATAAVAGDAAAGDEARAAAPAASSAALPPGWEARYSNANAAYYYVNAAERRSSWTAPSGAVMGGGGEAAPAAAAGDGGEAAPGARWQRVQEAVAAFAAPGGAGEHVLPEGWAARITSGGEAEGVAAGIPYYVHAATGASTWTLPSS